jgi:hypothetical protein
LKSSLAFSIAELIGGKNVRFARIGVAVSLPTLQDEDGLKDEEDYSCCYL